MPIETYKGFIICELWDKKTPYYIVCEEFKDDPFWEIGHTKYDTILESKKAIDQGIYN
tara:strand:+ start:347 stop:520 length:174 start_codon:yes stop_codon:yes gene_type:complete